MSRRLIDNGDAARAGSAQPNRRGQKDSVTPRLGAPGGQPLGTLAIVQPLPVFRAEFSKPRSPFGRLLEQYGEHPHASIGYKPTSTRGPAFAAWPAPRRPASPATLAQRPTLN